MGEAHYGNAMTEVALALAMAFFSIMILTMVSMSAAPEMAKAPQKASDKVLAAKLTKAKSSASKTGTISPNSEDTLVIYHQGKYLDKDLQPIDINNFQSEGRVVLALSPQTSMSEALAARSAIGIESLVVSTLNEKWLIALKRFQMREK